MKREHPLFALIYDPVTWMAERGAFGRFRARVISPLRGEVLEIGAGTGLNFPYYSMQARVLALEPDRSMLARARKRIARGAARITLEHAGDERLEALAPQSFDAVVCTFVLCTVENPAMTLAAIRRVLRPGGRLVVIEHVRSPGRLGAWQDRLRPLWERVAAGCQLNRDTNVLLAQAGFDVSALRGERIPGGIVRDVLVGAAANASDT